MKLNRSGFQRFLRQPDEAVFAVLIYGPDTGAVSEHFQQIKKIWLTDPDDPFALTNYSAGQMAASGLGLIDEMAAFSLSGGDRLIHLKNPVTEEIKACISAVEGFEKNPARPVARLLVEAGALSASSGLRKAFENAPHHAMAIACYPDSENDLSRLARQTLKEQGHEIEADALALLAASMPKDRQVFRSEMEKLLCYLADQPGAIVSLANVQDCIADAAEATTDELVFACTDGQVMAADTALQRALGGGQAPVMIVRAIARHLHRLHQVATSSGRGGSVSAAIAKLRPPVFFMHRERFTRQCTNWSLPRLEKALQNALETEKALKSSSGVDQSIIGRFVLAVSSLAR